MSQNKEIKEPCTECLMIGSVARPEHGSATPKIDGRMSDGKIYTEVSRKSNPEAHARIDALIATL